MVCQMKYFSEHPGFVFNQNTLNGDEVKKQLYKVSLDEFSTSILPQVLKPPGLTREHQKYLYESICSSTWIPGQVVWTSTCMTIVSIDTLSCFYSPCIVLMSCLAAVVLLFLRLHWKCYILPPTKLIKYSNSHSVTMEIGILYFEHNGMFIK